jgi:hypothetical protein
MSGSARPLREEVDERSNAACSCARSVAQKARKATPPFSRYAPPNKYSSARAARKRQFERRQVLALEEVIQMRRREITQLRVHARIMGRPRGTYASRLAALGAPDDGR